ncbi:hypothetical protein FGA82_22065 [Pseudomonas fluorescens]|uniref:hypothetical protein n=1 Tax=Pseudomonas fluorescens TaxID=294 RepID=UPI00112FE26C|nr:hypothetical protein [Pseudomonas fluorescens]TMU73957.1 hypothetical protein FGA82_22065 [Pseudomonas fluorescens]
MHAEAHSVLENVLMTCKTINAFGDLAIENLQHGIPNDLADVEKENLRRAFRLMRLTLDCVNPLITATVDEASQLRGR